MSAYTPKARDDFPLLADFARRPSGWDSALIDRRREAAAALDEIDELRRESESAPATIDVVAAAIRNAWPFQLATSHAPALARALAEAGLLRAPADEILTEADRAVIDAAEAWESGRDVSVTPTPEYMRRVYALVSAVRARRVAAGGTAPTDLPTPDASMCRCPSHLAGGTCWRFPTDPKEAKP